MKNNKNTLGSASSAIVRQCLAATKEFRINANEALTANGLSNGIFDNSISRIDGDDFQQLLHWLISRSGDTTYGLSAAKQVTPGSFGLLGYMMMNCRTLREALNLFPRYEAIVGNMGITRIERRGSHVALCWSCNYTDALVRPQLIDTIVGSWIHFIRWLIQDPTIKPTMVMLERNRPAERHLRVCQQFYGADVQYDAYENGFLLPDSILDTPLQQPDPELLTVLEQQATSALKELQDAGTLVLQTRSLLVSMMQHGVPRREKIAAQLGIAERTLQRRLDEADTSYQQLLDELRYDMSVEWLTGSRLSIADISERLGFSETRSFHRRFKNWSGVSPGEYRRTQLSNRGPEAAYIKAVTENRVAAT